MKREYLYYIIIITGLLFFLYYIWGQIRITVDFEELEPFRRSLPVYYKGFKLGHTVKVYPSPDFHSTRVDMKIRLRQLKLPANTKAMIRRKDKKDYIELIYPDSPYLAHLRNHSLLEGTKGINFENFMQEQANNGGLDEIKENVNETIKSAGGTFNALTEMINVMTGILEDVKPTINDTVQNVNLASRNLADASYHVQSSLQQGYINTTLENLERTSRNLVMTTQNITGVTNNVNNNSINLINCVIRNVNTVVSNINEIIIGLGETLKKRFAGIRLIFGRAIDCGDKYGVNDCEK
ncbi:MAG: hypothetical protein NC408_08530 [Candidatus Gastranaerophilales bacterium]|nr:hypothetical protein [Candidatus Gastranaerophilales bacterium]MCM1073544.1 hypothetical protein [Bacteroides sp.]